MAAFFFFFSRWIEQGGVRVEVEREKKTVPLVPWIAFSFHLPLFPPLSLSPSLQIISPPVMFGEMSSAGFWESARPCLVESRAGGEKQRKREQFSRLGPSTFFFFFFFSRAQNEMLLLVDSQQLTASTKPQLATGPQKCVVLGPVGESTKALRREAREAPPVREAAIRDSERFSICVLRKQKSEEEEKNKKKQRRRFWEQESVYKKKSKGFSRFFLVYVL